jgi:hypothetical protein
MTTALEHLQTLKQGDEISLVLGGLILDGVFEELVDNCVVLIDATSPNIKKKRYSLKIPVDSIYAWGKREKKKKKIA